MRMKRNGRIFILLFTLVLWSASSLYAVNWKFPARKEVIRRNRARVVVHGAYEWPLKRAARILPVRSVKRPTPRTIARARQDLTRALQPSVKEYTQSAQQNARELAANLRIRKILQTVQARARIELVRRRSFPTWQEVDAVIFDLDGTLLDSLWAWENSGTNYLRSIGIEPAEDLQEKLETMSLMDGARYVKQMYNLPDPPEVILEKTLAPIKDRYFYEIEAMPGVQEQLARLNAQGVKMAVATASHKDFAQAALKRLGMLDYFDFIITCDEVGVGKTSPKVYEEALARLGTIKERTLVAEDALYALETAHQAGFPTAAIEEAHSLEQAAQKMRVADYYIIEYSGQNTLSK